MKLILALLLLATFLSCGCNERSWDENGVAVEDLRTGETFPSITMEEQYRRLTENVPRRDAENAYSRGDSTGGPKYWHPIVVFPRFQERVRTVEIPFLWVAILWMGVAQDAFATSRWECFSQEREKEFFPNLGWTQKSRIGPLLGRRCDDSSHRRLGLSRCIWASLVCDHYRTFLAPLPHCTSQNDSVQNRKNPSSKKSPSLERLFIQSLSPTKMSLFFWPFLNRTPVGSILVNSHAVCRRAHETRLCFGNASVRGFLKKDRSDCLSGF